MDVVEPAFALEAHDIVKGFRNVLAVDRVSFSVRSGDIFALLGPNGAGKTTVIRMITGLLRPESGTLKLRGIDVRRSGMATRRLIGYVPQQLAIDGQLTGFENVWLFAGLYDVPRRERTDRVLEALAAVGLEGVAKRMAATYSGGMLRRLELSQALVNRPAVLLLDEPTIGLDPIARRDVWERVLQLRKEYGMTVMFTTHYMEEAETLANHVALMHKGRLRAIGTPEELTARVGEQATLEDAFRAYVGDDTHEAGTLRDVSNRRENFRRLG